MKKLWTTALLSGICICSSASDKTVWLSDFEGQFPGENPKNWTQHWGKNVEGDIRQISNMEVLSGNTSLLIDRSGTDAAQWGFGCNMANVTDGRAILEIPFLMQGGGGRAMNCCFEIFTHPYSNTARFATIRFLDKKVSAGDGKWNGFQMLGTYETSKWYKIVLKLPTKGGGQKDTLARLDLYEGDGKWIPGKEFTVKTGEPKGPWGRILFVPNPGSKFKIYLDNVRLSKE